MTNETKSAIVWAIFIVILTVVWAGALLWNANYKLTLHWNEHHWVLP